MTAAGPAANRPPHMRWVPPLPSVRVKPASTLLSAGWCDGGCLMFKRVVPALVGAILLGAVVLGVHYWDPGTPPGADHAGAIAVPPTSGTVRNFTPMNPGRPAPIESFFDAEGRALTLQQFAGKVVLL